MQQPWTVPAAPVQTVSTVEPTERDTTILAWRSAKADLEAAKEKEMALRKKLTALLFPTPTKGTQRFALGGGWNVKLVYKLDYKIDTDTVDAALEKIESQGPVGKLIAERLVKFDPRLSESEYKLLSEVDKKIIDSVLTVTPAAPLLEIEEPKAK